MPLCPICHQSDLQASPWKFQDYEYGVDASFGFVTCGSCGLYLADPLPDAETVRGFYPATYTAFESTAGKTNDWIRRKYARQEARNFRRKFPTSTVLDVGCGTGDFLSELGGNALGLEADPSAARLARGKGLSVKDGTWETIDWPSESLDVIRMNHAIEHFVSPRRALENAWKALCPGGVIMGETPNTDCLDFRLLGRYWGGMHFPRHLWLFSHRSLQLLAEGCGFRVKAIKNCYRTVGWSAGAQNFLVDKLGLEPPPGGRFPWYPLLISASLPLTAAQKLLSRTAVMEFELEKIDG